MKEIPIFSAGTPPTFNVPTSQADYWLQRLCYEASTDRYNANAQSITQKVFEASDMATLNTSVSSDLDGFFTWLDDFLNDKTTEYVGNLINLAPLMTAIASGGASEVLPLLVGHIINVLITNAEAKSKGANDNSNDQVAAESGPLLDNMHLEINIDPTKGDVDGLWGINTP